jgi:adenylate kinase family enzyme
MKFDEAGPALITSAKRILVLGTSGSGKTTLAEFLAEKLGITHYELDAFYHEANWQAASHEDFVSRVAWATQWDEWVICGNYRAVRGKLVEEADLVVWLDLPFLVSFFRVLVRSSLRIVSKEELWNGNRENFAKQFFSKDSLLLWVIQTHSSRRKMYEQQLPTEKTLRLRWPNEVGRLRRAVETGKLNA